MPTQRLPESVQVLYSELLDHALQAEAERVAAELPPGTFVSKEIKGARYWYLQVARGAAKRQHYLGPETSKLLDWMRRVTDRRAAMTPDREVRVRLAGMLARGGAFTESRAAVEVLRLLGDAGVFRRGGVLVGTRAFTALGNLLGVRFDQQILQTQDIDIAHDPAIDVALAERADVGRSLLESGLGFFPVPGLDPAAPSTSFKIRGRELRVDFLVPARARRREGTPVAIPSLGIAAQPLPFLGYLLAETAPAVVVGGEPVLVQIPTPARFALHKLWTARRRPAAQQVRAAKDRRQAVALLEVLAEDRPQDLALAWSGLTPNAGPRRDISAELARLPADLRDRLGAAGLSAGL